MNTFKRIALATVALAALVGCAGDKEFLKAQADSITAQSNARVAEAQQKSDEARAVIAVAPKLDAGGAAAYVLGLAFKGIGGVTQQAQAQIEVKRPRDWLDYLEGGSRVFGNVMSGVTPLAGILEQGRSTRASYQRDVSVAQVQQAGETARIQSVAAIGAAVASSQPQANVTTTTTLSGTGVLGSGTYTGPVSTTTNHNCPGGSGAAGGNGTTGSAGTGGSAAGGTC